MARVHSLEFPVHITLKGNALGKVGFQTDKRFEDHFHKRFPVHIELKGNTCGKLGLETDKRFNFLQNSNKVSVGLLTDLD